MIKVRIGSEERDINDASGSWITEQLVRRRRDEGHVCVQVIIDESQVDMTLPTPDCETAPGIRRPNPREQEIIVSQR